MSLLFWRKKDSLTGQESAVPVTKVDPLPVSPSQEDTDDALRVQLDQNNAIKVEQQFSYAQMVADSLVKTGPGLLHTITFSQADAAPTAGDIIVYDNTAESGTVIFKSTWTTAVFYPTTITLDVVFTAGLYMGFTTTADVSVTVSYR
jgi:hypothetical protein